MTWGGVDDLGYPCPIYAFKQPDWMTPMAVAAARRIQSRRPDRRIKRASGTIRGSPRDGRRKEKLEGGQEKENLSSAICGMMRLP